MTITKPCEGGKTEAEMERAHPEHQRGLDQFIPCIGCFGKPCSRFPLDVYDSLLPDICTPGLTFKMNTPKMVCVTIRPSLNYLSKPQW